jgi:lipopolysaccharide export system permease protein
VFGGILRRAIFGELLKVFVLSLLGITGIIVLAAIVQEATQRGLGPAQILAAIPLIVPSMMPFIIPPTTLFASCVVYGRLSHDNEILAIRAAGINILHVIGPGVVLGLATSAATFGLYYYLIPYTHRLLREAAVKDVKEFMYALLRREGELRRPELKLGYEIYVWGVQGEQLKKPIFIRRDAKGEYDYVASAQEAELAVDMAQNQLTVRMRHGETLDLKPNGTRINFTDQEFKVELPELRAKGELSARDMTWQELLARRREQVDILRQVSTELGTINTQIGERPTSPELVSRKRALEENIKYGPKHWITIYDVELQMRPALSCGCLFFVLVGCPVGIWFSRSDYLSAFITCFLPIVFVYYPLQLCTTNLAKAGKMDPALALWGANAIMAVAALALFRRLLKN